MTDSITDRILQEAAEEPRQRRQAEVTDYLYDKSQDKYWDVVTGSLHGAKAVDASVPRDAWRLVVTQVRDPDSGEMVPREKRVKPSEDIMRVESNLFVEASTWWPGQAVIIEDKYIDGAGVRDVDGIRLYNTYRPPMEPKKTKKKPDVWIAHVKRLFPDPLVHEYFFDYMAHTVQRPDVKINTAIVIAGSPKIGKDSLLDPIKRAVGLWNVNDIDPDDLFSQYKPWLQSVMLCINEVRATKEDFHATSMYNILKPLIAAPPEALALNDKYQNMRYVRNHMRVVMTTNDWLGMYVPPDDRRMFIMLSPLEKNWHLNDGLPGYFSDYWNWLDDGGNDAVAYWLWKRDISGFDAKAESPKTDAWHEVVGSWHSSVEVVERALEALSVGMGKRPDVVLGHDLVTISFEDEKEREDLMAVMKSSRKLSHRMNNLGYMMVACSSASEWQWRQDGVRIRSKVAFIRRELRLFGEAAEEIVDKHGRAKLAERLAAPNVVPLKSAGGF